MDAKKQIKNFIPLFSIFHRIVDFHLIISLAFLCYKFYPKGVIQIYWTTTFICWIGFSFSAGTTNLYRSWNGISLRRLAFLVFRSWVFSILVVMLFIFTTKNSDKISRIVITSWIVMTPIILILWRIIARYILILMRRKGYNLRSVAIAGAGDLGRRVSQYIADEATMGFMINGFYDDQLKKGYKPVKNIQAYVKGNIDQMIIDTQKGIYDIIYIVLPMRAQERIANILDALSELPTKVYIVPDFFFFKMLHSRWSDIGGIPILSALDTPYFGINGIIKRTEDIIISFIALLVAILPMFFIALAIKLTSPGPAIFAQERYGLDGKPFKVYKFRTMHCCEDGKHTFFQAQRNDQRVTRLGAFLRLTSIDELPQFFNVLKGNMAVVGPRPHPVMLDEEHRQRIRHYMSRNRVKPGITGYAQVHGLRGETDTFEKMRKRIEHDIWYIENWSIWLDLKIIFLTVISRKTYTNAY